MFGKGNTQVSMGQGFIVAAAVVIGLKVLTSKTL